MFAEYQHLKSDQAVIAVRFSWKSSIVNLLLLKSWKVIGVALSLLTNHHDIDFINWKHMSTEDHMF